MNNEERAQLGATLASIPVIGTALMQVSARRVQRLLGLWVLWHTCGGFKGLTEQKLVPRTTLYQNMGEFQQVFGVRIEDWQLEAVAALLKDASDV